MNSFKQTAKRIYAFNQYERDQWISRQAAMIAPGSLVLDVGAGSCPYRSLFSRCVYKTQDFTQLNDEQLLGRKGYGAIDYVCDILAIPVEDASVDVALCTEVLEHVQRPIEVLNEIGRLLKPGGKAILTAPLGSGLHQVPYHFYGGYTPFWYRHFLTEAGFEDIQIQPNGNFFKFWSQEAIRFVRRTSPRHLKAPLMKKIVWFPLWVLLAAWVAVSVPLIDMLDKHDSDHDFTIGYHVVAVKKSAV